MFTYRSILIAALTVTACAGDPSRQVVRVAGDEGGIFESGLLASRTVYVVPRRAWLDSAAVICRDSRLSRDSIADDSLDVTDRLQRLRQWRQYRDILHARWHSVLVMLSTQQSDLSPAGYSDSLMIPDGHSIFVVSDSLRFVGRRVRNVEALEEKDADAEIVLALTSPPATVSGTVSSGLMCSSAN